MEGVGNREAVGQVGAWAGEGGGYKEGRRRQSVKVEKRVRDRIPSSS